MDSLVCRQWEELEEESFQGNANAIKKNTPNRKVEDRFSEMKNEPYLDFLAVKCLKFSNKN